MDIAKGRNVSRARGSSLRFVMILILGMNDDTKWLIFN